MAKPLRNEAAQREFAGRLRRLSDAKPNLRIKDIERYAWGQNIEMNTQSIRNALNGAVDPTACSLELLMVLAGYFEARPEELGTHAAERLNTAHDHLKSRFGWLSETTASRN